MKRNNVAKRFGIASLCLATVFSAFSGIASIADDVAVAEETTIQTTDFLHTQATVTQDETGLRVSSDVPYSATFKGIFTGNTTFNFKFPETNPDLQNFYGDFTIRLTNASDASDYFDVNYYRQYLNVSKGYYNTGIQVIWGDQVRAGSLDTGSAYYNAKQTGLQNFRVAPAFLQKGTYGTRAGVLKLTWSDGVLAVTTNSARLSDASTMKTMAKFDGTYDETASKKGFSSASPKAWGLPKLEWPNGYTIAISSSFTSTYTEDQGSDVLFSSIVNGTTTYDFKTSTELAKDSNMEAFENTFAALTEADIPAAVPGKVFLGWRDTVANKIYRPHAVLLKDRCEPFIIDYDTVNGASVRIAGKSGIRFQTTFDAEQYAFLKESGFIESFGTIITYTDTLETVGKEFTIENYQDQEMFAKVENTKGVFNYTANDNDYIAYSMGVIDIADYTKSYSARGYLVIYYADGLTNTFYTDFNITDNSRSIAEVAYRLKTVGVQEYNAMSDAKKAIVDAYAAAYVAPQN